MKKVFGESILNDAVSIVLCNIMIKLGKDTTDAGFGVLLSALVEFSQLMVLSAFLGIFSALVCALVLKLGCQNYKFFADLVTLVKISVDTLSKAH